MIEVEATDTDYCSLVSGQVPPMSSVLAILHSKKRIFVEEIEYANSVLKEAGTYLSLHHGFRDFIRAEAEREFTVSDLEHQKDLLERLRELIPEINRLLCVDSPNRAGIVLEIVYDACSDYGHTLTLGRRGANLNRLIKKIEKLKNCANELSKLLDDRDLADGIGFERAYARYRKRAFPDSQDTRDFWELEYELKMLAAHLELEAFRIQTKPETVYVPDNQAKTLLVETAYWLALDKGKPQFVTTPGSDFGYLCSLLFEIATGVQDASLAGAVNRYARSKSRAESDQYEVDFGEERTIARDQDNFFDVKESAERAEQRVRELMKELENIGLSEEARLLILLELDEKQKCIKGQHSIHGPFVMWADQIKRNWQEGLLDLQKITALERTRDIRLGKSRRKEAKLT